ncbi:MAG: hypothetical protein A3F46_08985 [Legionellales bacterium RIFCSPHIGHO2_12_FULL_42_9]|nr:MAG: hypothetical protein A3F46_08985 [Legionellales bacterium RIFCSPHIGHO2_12_FULL_42_9]
MFSSLIKKTKQILISLRFSILFTFVTLFILAITTILVITYYELSQSMTKISYQLTHQISSSIDQEINNELSHALSQTQFGASFISNNILSTQKISNFVLNMMEYEKRAHPSVSSVFWSDEKGSVFLSGEEGNNNIYSQILTRPINSTPGSSEATRETSIHFLKTNTIKKIKEVNLTYDPRVREWYKTIKTTKKSFITDVYQFLYFGPHFWGITIASPAITPSGEFIGAYGINIRIDFLRKFIEKIKVSEHGTIFIVLDDDRVIAFPKLNQYGNPAIKNINSILTPGVNKSFSVYKTLNKNVFLFKDKTQQYLASYKPITGFGPHTFYIGIVIPEDDFVGVLKKASFMIFIIGLITLIVSILLVSRLISHIVQPMKKLVFETKQIKNFKLAHDIKIDSRIKEVIVLADALHDMKIGLRLFQKYVPAHLVRELIKSGAELTAGGAKKNLVVLFSDIKDFTSISEVLDPNKLMIQICEYFEVLSKIIMEEHGTIDKYIGDSIMTFWGAPLSEPQPCHKAARAAIRFQKSLNIINKKWQKQGLPVFITRIGIHMGDAIVGNLGSSERLNYTALGDNINVTSRLEGINKIYGTKIIVSAAIYKEIKNQFTLRFLDRVILKGKGKAIAIYELIAEDIHEVSFNITTYNKFFSQGFAKYEQRQWEDAIIDFKACTDIYQDDFVAPLFIQRCLEFKINPPDSNWSGNHGIHVK